MMSRFLLGVAVGYLFSDIIDELLGKTKEVVKEETDKKVAEVKEPDPVTPS
jgi:hypothetical protein